MKVALEFDINNLEELDKITKKIDEVITQYKVKMEIDSDELHSEE